MNMFRRYLWCFVFASILVSCNHKKGAHISHHLKAESKEIRVTNENLIQWEETPETWLLVSDKIICKTSNKNRYYTVYSTNNYKFLSSFGKKGHGNLEWVSPQLIEKDDTTYIVFDNGTKKIYNVVRETISFSRVSSINEPINDPKTITYPIAAYVSLSPNEQNLKIVNIENDIVIDKISFVDEKGQGQSSLYDFAWDAMNDKIVIAHLHTNRFIICTIDKDGRIIQTDSYETTSDFSKDKLYYFGVQCGKNIFLLSQKHVDTENAEGYSEIEVCDYDGNCIYKIKLDYIADKMLLDSPNNRIFTTSVSDDLLHIVSISNE